MELDYALHAESFGLVIVDPASFEIERKPHGRGYRLCANGITLQDKLLKKRVEALVIPPAWTDVKICIDENGHIQAIGRDAEGRLQYRYHDGWVNVRNAVKTERLLRFGHALGRIRAGIALDLRRKKPHWRRTAAVAAHLVDSVALRPGHEKYAADGGRGVASLRKRNLRIVRKTAILTFRGKSKQDHRIEIRDVATVRSLKRMRQGKGQRLFRFPDEKKGQRELTAGLLNEYLALVAGTQVTSKDFRTFHGSAEALRFLIEETGERSLTSVTRRKRAVAAAMRSVAGKLRNTPAVARSSYVHPEIISRFEAGELDPALLEGRKREGLNRAETGLVRFLERL